MAYEYEATHCSIEVVARSLAIKHSEIRRSTSLEYTNLWRVPTACAPTTMTNTNTKRDRHPKYEMCIRGTDLRTIDTPSKSRSNDRMDLTWSNIAYIYARHTFTMYKRVHTHTSIHTRTRYRPHIQIIDRWCVCVSMCTYVVLCCVRASICVRGCTRSV